MTLLVLMAYRYFIGSGHPYLVGLFPVFLAAILLGTIPASVSLALTIVFILTFEDQSHQLSSRLFYSLIFVVEGAVVIWIIASWRRVRAQLAATLARRSRELAQLQQAHDKLKRETGESNRSLDQLRKTNHIMLDTLERILGRSNRD